MTATLLLIYYTPKTIYFAWVILDFTILTQYILYDKEIFYYKEQSLYILEKTKLIFEQYQFIDFKLY